MNRDAYVYLSPILLCLMLLLGAAPAQAGADGSEDMPLTNGPVPPFQDMVMESDARNYTVHYPALGLKTLDQIIAAWAAGLVADAPTEALAEGDDGYRRAIYEMQARYSLSASTTRYFSIVFFTTQAVMDHRENIIYTLNFDLQNRKQLDLKAIFSNLEKSLPLLPGLIRKAAAGIIKADGKPVSLPYYIEQYTDYQDEFSRFITVAFCPEGLNVYLSASDVVLLHKEDLVISGALAKFWQ